MDGEFGRRLHPQPGIFHDDGDKPHGGVMSSIDFTDRLLVGKGNFNCAFAGASNGKGSDSKQLRPPTQPPNHVEKRLIGTCLRAAGAGIG